MITARQTRLLRAPDLRAFRHTLIDLSLDGDPLNARDRLVVVPTRAAAEHFRRSLESHALAGGDAAVILPELIIPRDLVECLASRCDAGTADTLNESEREVLLGVACAAVEESGIAPPFRLRPGLVAEILHFYDELRANGKDTAAFERLAVGELEPAAEFDRGADRLLKQTRFLVAAFRELERRMADTGALDEHGLRERVLAAEPARPWRHAVVALADRARERHGLAPVHWQLLAQMPGIERLDVVVTETALAGGFHEAIHAQLPGLDEVASMPEVLSVAHGPMLAVPSGGDVVHLARDREEEVGAFARRVRQLVREGDLASLDRAALVVQQPLPYVYVARETLRAAAIPAQTLDAVPLAAEPYAAALDLLVSAVAARFAREPAVALLRSPHFRFVVGDHVISGFDCAALDRALSEAGYLGGREALDRTVLAWREHPKGSAGLAQKGGEALVAVASELAPLAEPAPRADHLACLLAFLHCHERLPGPDDPARTRQLRARAAVLTTLESLRAASARFDARPMSFDEVVGTVRRWLEGQTFSLRSGEDGLHLVDADSARFGDFDVVRLAGLVEGEWPRRLRRNIFYSSALLRDLGWPAETDQFEGARNTFLDLLRLPVREVSVSRFTLEDDVLVAESPFLQDARHAGLEAVEEVLDQSLVFDYEALGFDPVHLDVLDADARAWGARRLEVPAPDDKRYKGYTGPVAERSWSVSALERYQDCPFQFFAAHVLQLDEPPEDDPGLSPRERGKLLHKVFQRFFETWDRSGHGRITSDTVDQARTLFAEVVRPFLDELPPADAILERARFFGSAIGVGIIDTVLGLEVAREAPVVERQLEYELKGTFALGGARPVALRGVADRIDLLEGRRLQVIDYKSGSAPSPQRALQAPVYALCAAERLEARDGAPWTVDEAAYVAFAARRALVPVVRPGKKGEAALARARTTVLDLIDRIGRGEFPAKPHETRMCTWCAYPTVCRKDDMDDA